MQQSTGYKIQVSVNVFDRKSQNVDSRLPCRKIIRRNNRILESTFLPVIMLLNPRSIYNKSDEFKIMVEQYEIDICCISESWDRENLPVEQILEIDGFKIVKNVVQRNRRGGKPIIIVNENKFHIQELCPDIVTVPVGVEAVWALVTPKNIHANSRVKSIAVASVYYTKATKSGDIIDHINSTFSLLSAKYGPNLHFAICGDLNRLNIKSILNVSPNLKQLVTVPTRRNPDATLDKIISTLQHYYVPPFTVEPIDSDDPNGKASDHLTVIFKPIQYLDEAKRSYRTVVFRPLTDTGVQDFGHWLSSNTWSEIYNLKDAHSKAESLQKMLLSQLDISLPEKSLKICTTDKPWINSELKKLDRQRKREYLKNKKSIKWKKLNDEFSTKFLTAKRKYYNNLVEDLKESDVGKWYSKIKRMSCDEQTNSDDVQVMSMINVPVHIQAEKIADAFALVSNQYSPLENSDVDLSLAKNIAPMPKISEEMIYQCIFKMKSKISTVFGDIPWKLVKVFASEISAPLADIFNTAVINGEYPDVWKLEIVTPVTKVNPPEDEKQLRKIACTKNFSKIFEKILSDFLIKDMAPAMDKSQYGNEKGISVQHCLIKMLDTIQTKLDINNQNEKYAAILTMVDYSQAFDRQCPKLGIQSFMRNGVRRELIPLLANFFQNRRMKVKWKGHFSTLRNLPGGNPQGSTTGLLGYKSQTNNNTDVIPTDMKYKWVDDLNIIELIELLSVGLVAYDFFNHVASDIGTDQKYLPSSSTKTQEYINHIAAWTKENLSKLNAKKTKTMIINFTKKTQFSTRITLEKDTLEIVSEAKILGCLITDDLKFHKNTQMMIRRAYARMIILQRLYPFNIPTQDLIIIYVLYIRSLLEQNVAVWSSSITQEDVSDIERVQKVALKIILKSSYENYEQALKATGLQYLSDRRSILCLRFAKKCLRNEKTRDMFPLNPNFDKRLRHSEKYQVKFAHNDRLKFSAVPSLQRMLNEEHKLKQRASRT